jgi:hypothetical protein
VIHPTVVAAHAALRQAKEAIEAIPERVVWTDAAQRQIIDLTYALKDGIEFTSALGAMDSCEDGCAHRDLDYYGAARTVAA